PSPRRRGVARREASAAQQVARSSVAWAEGRQSGPVSRQVGGKADMRRRLLTAIAMAMVLAAGGATSARADQAVLLDFVGPIPPGGTEEWSFTLAIAGHGIPNVAYENAESFAVGETVTAVITPV